MLPCLNFILQSQKRKITYQKKSEETQSEKNERGEEVEKTGG